tara:strand:+ start:4874 stop:5086 length:213 start_codon:yes stop_codon:yes gene_type:complete
MIGWIGLILLMLAYLMLVTKWSKLFIPIDTIASLVLTIHAFSINDVVFLLVNGWITVILAYKWYNRELTI